MQLSTSTVALGVAILVVAMLLMSCCCKDACSDRRSKDALTNISKNVQEDSQDKTSDWGTGVNNRQSLQRRNDIATNLKSYDDYNQLTMYEALDPSVMESHESYASNIGVTNSGASALTVRSDDNNIVPWVGLRRPNYQAVYADSSARTQPSEFTDQMPVNREFKY